MEDINWKVLTDIISNGDLYNAATLVLIGSLVGLFNMYRKSANKHRDKKEEILNEARTAFENASKQFCGENINFDVFYDLLKYSKSTDEYYQLHQLIDDKNKVELKKYVKDKLWDFNKSISHSVNEPDLAYKFIPRKMSELRIYENLVAPAIYTFFTIYLMIIFIIIILNINKSIHNYFMVLNLLTPFSFFVIYGSLLIDDDMTLLSTIFIKILVILEFVAATTIQLNVAFGNIFTAIINLAFFITIIVTRSKNNVKNVTSILNKKRKFRGYNKIISFVKSQNGELLSDEKLVSFIYFFNHKIYGIYQFKKIENNKFVLVKEIRKSYYDSIIDQKKVFSEIEENSKCRIIQ